MNQRELITTIVEKTGFHKSEVTRMFETMIETCRDTLIGGGEITLRDFGTFSLRARQARTGRNPRTGDPVAIKARLVIWFTPARAIKNALTSLPLAGTEPAPGLNRGAPAPAARKRA